MNEPPPLIPINPFKDSINNNQDSVIHQPSSDLDQLRKMIAVLPPFRIPSSPAPRRKSKTSRSIHSTLCCDPCKEVNKFTFHFLKNIIVSQLNNTFYF